MTKVLNIGHSQKGGGLQSVFRITNSIKFENLKNYSAYANFEDDSKPDIELKRLSEYKNSVTKLFAYFFIPKNYFSIKNFLKNNEIDVIHLHGSVGLSLGMLYAIKKYKKNSKVILSAHGYGLVCPVYSCYSSKDKIICTKCIRKGNESRVILNSCDRRGRIYSLIRYIDFRLHKLVSDDYKLYDKILTPSDYLKTQLETSRHQFANIQKLANPIQGEENNYSLKDKKNDIVFMGRFSEEKNVQKLIEAFKIVKDDKKYKDVELRILGEGKEKENYIELIRNLNLEQSISISETFLTYEELTDYLKKSKVLVLPTVSPETFGLTILEGIKYGLLPVTYDIGAQAENINKVGVGYLAKYNSVNNLAYNIKKAITDYESKTSDIKKANEVIENEFSVNVYHENLYKIYKNLI